MPWDTYAQRRIRAPVSDIRAAEKRIVAANNAILQFFLWSSSEYLEKIVKRWCEDMRKFGESIEQGRGRPRLPVAVCLHHGGSTSAFEHQKDLENQIKPNTANI